MSTRAWTINKNINKRAAQPATITTLSYRSEPHLLLKKTYKKSERLKDAPFHWIRTLFKTMSCQITGQSLGTSCWFTRWLNLTSYKFRRHRWLWTGTRHGVKTQQISSRSQRLTSSKQKKSKVFVSDILLIVAAFSQITSLQSQDTLCLVNWPWPSHSIEDR